MNLFGVSLFGLCKWVLSLELPVRPSDTMILVPSDPDGSPGRPVPPCWDTLGPHRDYCSGSFLCHVPSRFFLSLLHGNGCFLSILSLGLKIWKYNKQALPLILYKVGPCVAFMNYSDVQWRKLQLNPALQLAERNLHLYCDVTQGIVNILQMTEKDIYSYPL